MVAHFGIVLRKPCFSKSDINTFSFFFFVAGAGKKEG